jgi:alpha-tubulin suppressor-like RCC1 family protein
MFVLTEKGEVVVYKIIEKFPDMDLFDHMKSKNEIHAELKIDSPVIVKDLSNIKMISCGSDHFLALDNKGLVYAMGDDTFG